jgi:hypothetical protein
MARLGNVQIQTCADTSGDCKVSDQRQLLFTTVVANVGAGAFELHGWRTDTSQPYMSTATGGDVDQRIYDDAGGYRDVPTSAVMYYAGDGQNHWHVKDLECYTLIRVNNGKKVGTGSKQGLCFADNVNYGASTIAYYGPGAPTTSLMPSR